MKTEDAEFGPPSDGRSAASTHPDTQRLRLFCLSVLGILDATGEGSVCTPALPRELARVIGAGVEKVADVVRQEANALAVAIADLRELPSQFLNLGPALAELESARALAVQVADALNAFRAESPHSLSVTIPEERPHCEFLQPAPDHVVHSLAAASMEPAPESMALSEPLAFLESDTDERHHPDDTPASPTLETHASPTLESPLDPTESRQAVRMFLEGECHHKQQNFDVAEEFYTEAVSIDPQFGSAYARRGQIRLAHGDYDSAIADFDEALKLDETAVEALWWRGDAHAIAGKLDEAVADYALVLTLQPDLTRARFNLAVALRQKGETVRALVEFTRVIKARPSEAKAYLKRGEIHLKHGHRELAEADFRSALRHDPECEQAQHYLDTLPAAPSILPVLPVSHTTAPVVPIPLKSSTSLASPTPLPPKSSIVLASSEPTAPKSSTALPRTGGPLNKAGHITVKCPHCEKMGDVPWDRLSKVFVCQGCGRRFIVQSDGSAVEVIEAKNGKWVEAEKVREQARQRRKRRRSLFVAVVVAVLFPALAVAGWRAARPVVPQIVERELPQELNARAELFAQAWLSNDVRLMKRMTSPAVEKTLYAWYNRHRPPPLLRTPTSGTPPEGVDGAQVEVNSRHGKAGQCVVTLRVRNPKLAPDHPPVELRLVWEERSDNNWYFLP